MLLTIILHILLATAIFDIQSCYGVKYHNYTLFRGVPINEKQLLFFKNMKFIYKVNYWREPGILYKPVDFAVPPNEKDLVLRDALNNDIYLLTVIKDLQSAFDMQTVKTYFRSKIETFNWNNYFRLEDIYNYLKDLSRKHPNVLQITSIGRSGQNRDIMAVKFAAERKINRFTVIIEGGIHPREWISPTVITYIISQLVNAQHSNNDMLKFIAWSYDWYFVPVLNPDGYEYTHTTNRMWRTNMQGVDLNRNFDAAFGTKGISRVKGDEIYCGPKAFSEPESAAMAKFLNKHSKNLLYYLTFHSYGQYIIIPYAHVTEHRDNYYEVYVMASEAIKRILRIHNIVYKCGTTYETVGYQASGASTDWVKQVLKIPYVLTFELRDDGKYGFALPPDQILPTCNETLEGVIALLTSSKISKVPLKEYFDNGARRKRTNFNETTIIVCVILFYYIIL